MSTLYLVSAGPGNPELVTPASTNALEKSSDVVAYGLYLELLGSAVENKQCHELSLGEEIEIDNLCRVLLVLNRKFGNDLYLLLCDYPIV